ncbi:MAG TPA: cyclic nucleotide-binding domain-containing protein [Blastocatellia bacterium]|nr:cyclic nucleotide-binding domain-containing protein [Blastocatellia bacterium]
MPREHKSRREVIDAIRDLPSTSELLSKHDGHFDHELDLEVTVYGRNYGGKKVGPYVRLLTFEPGETIVTEGEWGGNTFFAVVRGEADVFIATPNNQHLKVAELKPGTQFGEMSILAGVPRSATVRAQKGSAVQVLEVQRPALRLLRKLPAFSEALDSSYRSHGRDNIIEELKQVITLTPELTAALKETAEFRVFTKNHLLFREATPIDHIYFIKQGWLRRSLLPDGEDFLGHGFWFGVDGILREEAWPYSVTLMGRTEVLELSIKRLRHNTQLRETLDRELMRFGPPPLGSLVSPVVAVREKETAAQRRLIETGLVDATNLLIMDMDLCVRCGNCSLACHKIHGQSRLTRHGIHVTRLERPSPRAIQSALSPAVCMHCQDPECLTGCPTGAIGRFVGGQIDIDPKTCIGCGDCATQCPYNAISMVSRKAASAPDGGKGLVWKLRDFLRLRPDPLPPPVDATDDLVAVKCNLCNGTSMNPPGSKKPAYACEESCPTGALARINPQEYFTEIGRIEGLLMRDQTHAIGRNIHRSDPLRRMIHLGGVVLLVGLAVLAVIGIREHGLGQRLVGFLNMRWITGLVGLVGIAATMTYPVRRKVYTKRKGALRYWMLAHAYLGVIAGVMILLHGGTDSGGALTTALMISFDLVVATGLFGIFCYLVVPRLMTKIEGEPLLIDDLIGRRIELQSELRETAASSSEPVRNLMGRAVSRFLSFGYLVKQYLSRAPLGEMLASAGRQYQKDAESLGNPADRRKFERAVEAAATLRRIDALILLHRSLKLWLVPHVIFTSLMLALMVVHIVQVIYFA